MFPVIYIDLCEQRGVVSELTEEEKVGGEWKSQVGHPGPVSEELRKLNSDRVLPQRCLGMLPHFLDVLV